MFFKLFCVPLVKPSSAIAHGLKGGVQAASSHIGTMEERCCLKSKWTFNSNVLHQLKKGESNHQQWFALSLQLDEFDTNNDFLLPSPHLIITVPCKTLNLMGA